MQRHTSGSSALRERHVRMLSHAIRSVLDAVFITDRAGHFLFANPAFERLYGHSAAGLSELTVDALAADSALGPGYGDVEAGAWVGEVVHRHRLGTPLPVWLSISRLEDESLGDDGVLVYVARDMSERRRWEDSLQRANERLAQTNHELEVSRRLLEELAFRDELTGLFNRRELDRMLADEIARSARSGHPLTLLLLDVDHFKRVNDQLGHLAGDAVLERFGRVLLDSLRQVDRAARFGGEEFAVLLPDTTATAAVVVAERIRGRIASTSIAVRSTNGVETGVAVTVSIGIAGLDPGIDRPRDLIERADGALYQAKARGRNCSVTS
jgi:diguanylate cyclase (GGDEF)-like protein/PAS domain S-box-containing protein